MITKKEAISKGLKRYFTGKPCKRGHICERNVSKGECIQCKELWWKERPELKREKDNDYRKKNSEYLKIWFKENYEKNRESIRERQSIYAALNSEKAVIRAKKWKKENPEAVKASTRNRRARIKQCTGTHTRHDIAELFEKQNGRCKVCPAYFAETGYHVDHIIAIARGGSNGKENLQLLCPSCNHKKGSKTLADFLQHRKYVNDRANIGKQS